MSPLPVGIAAAQRIVNRNPHTTLTSQFDEMPRGLQDTTVSIRVESPSSRARPATTARRVIGTDSDSSFTPHLAETLRTPF